MNLTKRLRPVCRTALVAAVAATGLLAGGTAQAAPASAATTHIVKPQSATGCSGNVCLYLSGNSGGEVLVQAWARTNTFTGQFHLTGPGVNWYSADQSWKGSKGNYASHSWYAASGGQVCVGAYSDSGTYEGTACENL
ncbi:hypothetical protein ACEZDG_04710 [Streptacidiphilus sp. N1-1]